MKAKFNLVEEDSQVQTETMESIGDVMTEFKLVFEEFLSEKLKNDQDLSKNVEGTPDLICIENIEDNNLKLEVRSGNF